MTASEQKSLFASSRYRPLADRLRPEDWAKFQGLENFDQSLIASLKNKESIPPSLILWGPPGCGKTTLARIIGQAKNLPFVEFSAVLGGVKEIREIVAKAEKFDRPTLLFTDEIHRFSKAQQDAFLPHIESGVIILIGATTENPSFYLNSALLSRARVLTFKALSKEALQNIINTAASEYAFTVSEESLKILENFSAGDARKLLNLVERIINNPDFKERNITPEIIRSSLNNEHNYFYDRSGEEHYNTISAFIKSLRGSDADAALYWGFRMLQSGEDPLFIIRRLIIFASEDIGNADPRAITLATSTLSAFEAIGLPEGRIPIAQCITYLATAPKSNRSYAAMKSVLTEIEKNPKADVPLHLRNAPTKLMKNLDYGKGYQYPHEYDDAFIGGVKYLPAEIEDSKFYEPSDRGYEKTIKERLDWLKIKSKQSS